MIKGYMTFMCYLHVAVDPTHLARVIFDEFRVQGCNFSFAIDKDLWHYYIPPPTFTNDFEYSLVGHTYSNCYCTLCWMLLKYFVQ